MLKVGSPFGNYVVERLIDHGGAGYVYLVRHRVLKVERALKVLDPERGTSSSDFVERFNREAQIVCRIHHPNLVEVFDAGVDAETGLRYIVMEYVPGGTLRGRLKSQGRLPWREALGIVRQTAEALVAVERRGSVHRDIKPDNIMFAADGSVRLADFGIAKAVADDEEDTLQTCSGQSFGTPSYMSPEQIRNAASVDGRSDIWSLGVVLFEMLVGHRPYRANSLAGIVAALLSDSPFPDVRAALAEAPSAVGGEPADEETTPTLAVDVTLATIATIASPDPVKETGEMPDEVVQLVASMCEKDVGRRIASCEEVIRRIDVLCGESAPVGDAAASCGRSVRVVAAAVLVLAVGGAVFLSSSRQNAVPTETTPPAASCASSAESCAPTPAPSVPAPAPDVETEKVVSVPPAPPPVPASAVRERKAVRLEPLTPGCTVCIGGRAEGAVSRPVSGLGSISRAVAEAVASRAGVVILSPAEACARANVSLNGYTLAIAEACASLREVGIDCRYRRGTGAKARPLDEEAGKICVLRSVPVE